MEKNLIYVYFTFKVFSWNRQLLLILINSKQDHVASEGAIQGYHYPRLVLTRSETANTQDSEERKVETIQVRFLLQGSLITDRDKKYHGMSRNG